MGNNDYIDTIVPVEKTDSAESAPDHDVAVRHDIAVENDVRLTRVGGGEVSSLAIDKYSDDGGDPYNSTGKHCILKIKE